MKRVLLADDHAVTRRGLREIVRELRPHAEIEEAADGHTALALAQSREFDLALIDVMMPGPGIVALLRALRDWRPELPVLVITASTEIGYVMETLQAGARGLVHKHQADVELAEAIARVAAGGTYLRPDVAAQLAQAMREPQPAAPHDALSPRELEVMRRIARGQTVKQIAFDLSVSDRTVATYLNRIRSKTGLGGHVEIARYALQHRLVD